MEYSQNTSPTLIDKIKNQYDEQSWAQFIEAYEKYIYIIVDKISPGHDIDDIVQEVLLRLWKSLPNFNYHPEKCKFRSWMGVIIRNTLNNYHRSKYKQRKIIDDYSKYDIESHKKDDLSDIIETAWQEYITNLAFSRIEHTFSGKAIECFNMFLDGSHVNEIMEKLDLKANSAYVLKNRVKDQLLKEIRILNFEIGGA